ncbi:14502_t:CDS:2 [Racocetra fulgida]|uniref:14502_t:CDS:1 n=1 Tax=Racocetra fulgida TaxID=60492 RepID=A0A9N9ENX4_9GLOM|nr:14502_t:CDS:2 [Racocetra fulgida]
MEAIADSLARSDYDIVCLQEVWVYDNYELVRNRTKKRLTSAVVDHPVSGLIEVFNTHVHASYGSKKNDEYLAHRVSQAWEAANLMKISASRGRNVGDYNSEQDTLAYKLITQHGQMTDSWQSQNSDTPISASTTSINQINQQEAGLPAFDANAAIHRKGITCDSPINTWSKIPELGYSYSDHFGVEATFTLVGRDKNSVIPLSVWEQGPYETLHELDTRTIKNMIELLDRDLSRSQTTSRVQIFLFYICLLLVFGLIAIEILFSIGTISTYFWVKIIINVAIAPIAVYGAIMGYVGVVFGNSEKNALKQLISEIRTYNEGKKTLESRESKGSSVGFEDNDSGQRSSAAVGINIELGSKDAPYKL